MTLDNSRIVATTNRYCTGRDVGDEYIRIELARAVAFVPDHHGHSSVAADEQAEASEANAASDQSRRAKPLLAA